jgi:hypothetical protein
LACLLLDLAIFAARFAYFFTVLSEQIKPLTYCFAYFIIVSTGNLKLRQMTNQSCIGSSPLQETYPTQGEGHQATTPFLKDLKAIYMMIVHSHHYVPC